MKADDKLGFEFLIDRKIKSNEIDKIKHLPQTVGWRYMPNSNKRALSCVCPMCIEPGGINSRKKREKIEPKEKIPALKEIMARLKLETDEFEIDRLFALIRIKKRRTDPEALRFIIDSENISAIRSLALSIEYFKHPNAIRILTELCGSIDDEVREYSAQGVLRVDKINGTAILKRYRDDEVILKVLAEHSNE